MNSNSILGVASQGEYAARDVSPITLALGTVFFLGVALSMLSSTQRNKDFWAKPGDPLWSIRRGMDRARTVMASGLGAWGLGLLLTFLAPEPRGTVVTITLGVLGLIGFGLLLVAGSVVLFNWPKWATPAKFRQDQSPVWHFLRHRGRA